MITTFFISHFEMTKNMSATQSKSPNKDTKLLPKKQNKNVEENDYSQLEDENEDDQSKAADEEQKSTNQSQNDDNSENKEEEEESYVVEKVIKHRVRHKKLQFLLKWEGWGEEDNSWEDFENLSCPEKIVEYRNQEISRSGLDVLSLLSFGQRLFLQEIFEDDPSVYKDIKYKKYPPEKYKKKKTVVERKKKDKDKKKDKTNDAANDTVKAAQIILPKLPDFEVISPDFQTSNPLLRIEGVEVKDGEIFYKVRRRKLPSELVSSKVLKKTYPERLASFLSEIFTGTE